MEVVGIAPEDECGREMFVETPWEHERTPDVPLSQLGVAHADEETRPEVEGRHDRVDMGYGS